MRGFALLPLLLVLACGSEPERSRVLVLGLDGLDPQTVDLLMSEGRLPNLAKIRQEGAYGRLISQKPLLSPIIWTTIATGKTPVDHRIGHFVAINEQTGEELPVTSQMRGVKAIWNIFSEANRKVGVVGWWATWPAESVHGAIVSDHLCYHFLFDDGARGSREPIGVTYPADLYDRLEPMILRPAALRHEEIRAFVDVTEDEFARPFDFDDDLSHFKWAYTAAETHRAIGKYLWQQDNPDLLMVYIEAPDSTSHLFGHLFRAAGLAGELADQQRRYGRTVEEVYAYADRIVGEYLALMDDRTTLIVLSDHGFRLGELPDDPSKTRDMRRVSEAFHRIEGILYAVGYRVRRGGAFDQPVLLDLAPTILALGGVAPPRDMPGRVLHEALDVPREERRLASYEVDAKEPRTTVSGRDAAVDPAIMERLRALGYLDTESPTGDRNLAALMFQEGRYEEAVAAYRALVAVAPEDGALRASLAGALGALGRYQESLEELAEATRLAPLHPEGYHNRGVIFEKLGDEKRAIAEYRQALRYAPTYEASQQALRRLGAATTDDRDGDAVAAVSLADEASLAARRGDYAGAMDLLDRAEAIAPESAMLYQYRANVAFLMGDKETARRALRRALELEPDNALFRSNLDKLD